MISRYEAYMDGVSLSSIDPAIYVLNIVPDSVQKQYNTNKVANRMGSRVVKASIESTSVTVNFEIHEYDTVKRDAICRKIQQWADGNVLEVSNKPEQQLECVCTEYPVADAKNWTEELSMVFTAYNVPYWQEKNAKNITVTTENETAYVPGNAPESLVSAVVTVGSSITSCTLSVGSKSITLSGISASAGDTITLDYDEKNILRIKKNNTSILNKRTAASADDLTAVCGKYNTFSAPATCSTVFTVRGCWY